MKLPDFLIAGASRSGTTSIYNYLGQHPDIFMSRVKEPCFFSFANEEVSNRSGKSQFITKFKDYTDLFKDAESNKCIGEASTPYLYFYKRTIENIKRYVPEHDRLKIIIILRNPVERAFSQYMMLIRDRREHMSFEDAIEAEKKRMEQNYHIDFFYTDRSFYYKGVKAYLDNFKHVKINLFEDLTDNPSSLIRDYFRFLGVDDSFLCSFKAKHNISGDVKSKLLNDFILKNNLLSRLLSNVLPVNVKKNIKANLISLNSRYNLNKTEMSDKTRRYLIGLYKDDVKQLENLIVKDLSLWLR